MFIISPLSFLLLCFLVGYFWRHKGRSFWAGVFTSIALTPILGTIIGIVLRPKPTRILAEHPPTAGYKPCPDCGELIRNVARRCRFCNFEFDNPLYEILCQRLQTADQIRATLVTQYGHTQKRLDDRLKTVQYELLGEAETLRQQARTYSSRQLRELLAIFPSKSVFYQQMEYTAQQLTQYIECPACNHLQPKEHLLCEKCYADLQQVNPDTGEIEPIQN